MRILHLLSQTELTGAEVYVQALAEMQKQDAHEVFVISDNIHVPINGQYLSLPISKASFLTRLNNVLKLRQFIKEKNVDIVHCHSRAACKVAYRALLGLKVAQVTTLHGHQHFSWSKKIWDHYGQYIIANCLNVKLSQHSRFATPYWKMKEIGNPISAQKYPFTEKLSQTPKLALIGRSSGPKGERLRDLFIEGAAHWLKEIPDLEIHIIANRPERFGEKFHQLCKELNQGRQRVYTHGRVIDLNEQFKNFTAVIGAGRVAIEALYCGIPCYALGEYSSESWLRMLNFDEAKNSNFGDIGSDELAQKINISEISQEVLQGLKKNPLLPSEREALRNKALENFEQKTVHKKILEVYKAALFKKNIPQSIPILMYHRVPDHNLQTQHRIFITKENFIKHLDFFKASKKTTLSFSELKEFWELRKDFSLFPKNPIILTFDDGYHDNLTNVQPLLKKYNLKATLFLLSNHQITTNTWDAAAGETPAQLMSLEEKKKIDQKVFEIGSHGHQHLHLNKEGEENILNELKTSKAILEKDLQAEICVFAYPFGSIDERLSDLAKKSGYSFAVNTDQGGLHLADDPCGLFRVNIFPEDGPWQLKKKTASWYRKYYYLKRGH